MAASPAVVRPDALTQDFPSRRGLHGFHLEPFSFSANDEGLRSRSFLYVAA